MVEQILKSYLEYVCGRENVAENVPLAAKTTFKIGGPARFFVTVPTKETLMRLVSTLKYIDQPYVLIGAGANILAADAGYDGVVLRLGFAEIADNGCFVYADAGAPLKKLCVFAREHALSGLEFAAGIPGTVGGAVFMNAGAEGGAMSDVVAMADVLADGEIRSLDARELGFKYRSSIFQNKNRRNWIILGAYFFLKSGKTPDEIAATEAMFLSARRETQPMQPSAGSVFKRRSPDIAVSKIIDELGLKGTQIGGARISDKHAGFIVNTGGATAANVLALVKLIRMEVRKKHNINLKTEIQIIK